MSSKKPDIIYKEEQFKLFIQMIKKSGNKPHWAQIAQALDVAPNTITSWKKRPEAQQAILEGIEYAMSQMEKAGSKDWRMWESKLKMLGVSPVNEVTVHVNPVGEILGKYGLDNVGQTKEIES